MSSPTIICIDGSIGTGKSTVLTWLRGQGYTVYTEDVVAWAPFLNRFQADATRWSFTLQLRVLISMYEQKLAVANVRAEHKYGLVFVERCPESSLAFVRTALDLDIMSTLESDLFQSYYNVLHWRPSAYIRLCASTDTIMARIDERGRQSEKDISERYLLHLQTHYDRLYDELEGPVAKIETEGVDTARIGQVILTHVLP